MEALTLVQNDRLPALYGQAVDWERYRAELPDQEWNLDGATITLKVRERDTTTILETISCSIVDAGTGWFMAEWPADSLDLDVSKYEGELSIVIGGKTQTAVVHFWDTHEYDAAGQLPISVKGEF